MHDFGVDHPGAVELEGGEGQLEADLPLVGLDSRLAVVEEAEGEDQDYRGDAEPHDLKRGGVVRNEFKSSFIDLRVSGCNQHNLVCVCYNLGLTLRSPSRRLCRELSFHFSLARDGNLSAILPAIVG